MNIIQEKKILPCLLLLLISYNSLSQSTELVNNEVRKTAYQGKSYLVVESLTIQPPVSGGSFFVSAIPSNQFFIRMLNNAPQQKLDPNPSQNYIRSEIINQSAITTENQITNLDAFGKSVSFEYFDGVTRPLQNISVKGSPSQKDIVAPLVYDVNGRQSVQYLPYAANTQDGSLHLNAVTEQNSFYNSSPKVSADGRPFTEGIYENSALNRLKQIKGSGDLWLNANKKGQIIQDVNVSPVEKWEINASGMPFTSSSYPANTIMIKTIIDEDNNISLSYTDPRGLVIKSITNNLTTFYVYDDLGNLRFIIPPKLATVNNPTQSDLDNYVSQYVYNNRQRVIKEKSPGKDNDWVYTVYDQWDRPVLTQDGVQRSKSPNEWSFIKYDAFSRPIMTGVLQSNSSYDIMLQSITGGHHEDRIATALGYTLTSSSPSVSEPNVLTVQYYDDYAFLNYTGWDAEGNSFSPKAGLNYITSVKTLLTGSKIRLLGQSKWLNAVTYYDNNYQEIQSIEEHHLSGTDVYFNSYDFSGQVTQNKRIHTSSVTTATITEDYEYDHAGRLLKTFHQIDNNPRILLASLGYNELGQLIENNLHSTDNGISFLQSVDYRYNIRGWLTHINNSKLNVDSNNDDTNDLFGMELTYNKEALNVNGIVTTPRYNGTITAARWKTDNKNDTPKERAFGYDYNSKNWIEKGNYAAYNGTGFTDEAGFYNLENINYDENGNIVSLKRYGKAGTSRTVIDDLTYGYSSNGNQLTNVEDTGNGSGFTNGTVGVPTEYQYDKNANVVFDLNSSITSVTYNYINLPQQVVIDAVGTSNDYTIDYTYDATGYEVKKLVKQGATIIKQIDYVNGIQYVDGQIGYIFTPLGRANKNGNNYEYEYFLKDHLGNTRVAFGMLHEVNVFKATMEPGNAPKEEADFLNIAARRQNTAAASLNKTPPTPNVPNPSYTALVKGNTVATSSTMGPAKILQTVKAGEKVNIQTYAISPTGTNGNVATVSGMAAIVANSFGITNGGETQALYNAFQNLNSTFFGGIVAGSAQVPKAYIAYIIFNNTLTSSQFGYKALLEVNKWEQLGLNITVPFDGTMYIYVANESTVSECYFDETQIVHEKLSSSLQVTASADYDPFGYLIEGTRYINTARLANNYLYQSNYSEFDEITGWNSFALRGNYDSRLGRWHSADPYGQYASPFIGMGNNPVNGVDRDGGWLSKFNLKTAFIGAAIGTAYGLIQDPDNWGYYAGGGFLAGGFLGSDFAKVNIWGTHHSAGLNAAYRNGKEVARKNSKSYFGYKRPPTVKLDRPYKGIITRGLPGPSNIKIGGNVVSKIKIPPSPKKDPDCPCKETDCVCKTRDDVKKPIKVDPTKPKGQTISGNLFFRTNSSDFTDEDQVYRDLDVILQDLNSNPKAIMMVKVENKFEATKEFYFDGKRRSAGESLRRQADRLRDFIKRKFPNIARRVVVSSQNGKGSEQDYEPTNIVIKEY